MDSSLAGRTLGGVYRIDALLGEGGMGAVYAATHTRTGRPYAVKVLKLEVAVRADAMRRFAREAEAVGALHHANVVAIHDFHVEGSLAYLVMDRLEGEDLSARMERTGPMSVAEALPIVDGMAAGLGAAHARGMVHRDLKPANVFLARQPGMPERPVLLDFGLAKSLTQEDELALTASGLVMGTPQYMSPEQAAGLPVDGRADLYALATVTYELLAGRPPFEAPTIPALFAQLAAAPPPPIRRFRPDLPATLEAVLERALAKSPADRFPDAASLAGALREAAGPLGPSTPIGNHAAAWPDRAPVDPLAATAATPVSTPRASDGALRTKLLLGAVFVAAALLGTALFVGAYLLGGGGRPDETAPAAGAGVAPVPLQGSASALTGDAGAPPSLGEVAMNEPADPEADPTPLADGASPGTSVGSVVAGSGPAVEASEVEASEVEASEVEASEAPRRRRARSGGQRGSVATTERTEPPAEATPPSSAQATPPPQPAPAPASGPPAGVQESVAYMSRRDWAGCIRETRRHPRSEALLSARMNCAIQSGNHDAIRSACADIARHYPASPYNQTCRSVMNAYGIPP